jgi:hypothetical protein
MANGQTKKVTKLVLVWYKLLQVHQFNLYLYDVTVSENWIDQFSSAT